MHTNSQQRLWRTMIAVAALGLGLPDAARAQNVVACDFDIADNLGRFTYGNTIHLTGSSGAATDQGRFLIVNGNTPESDLDKDGYAVACDYTALFIAAITNLTNVENPALAIPSQSVVVSNLPRALASGQSAQVNVVVQLPAGTVAGRYIGQIEVRDNNQPATPNASRELLNVDVIDVEVVVTAEHDIAIVHPDSARRLDEVTILGRAGQRASGVFRIANEGNAPTNDVRLTATDLRSESAVGLVIPSENITFSPASLATLDVADSARITVTVRIPRNLLSGRYRGTILAQAEDAEPQAIPFVVVVTSFRGILFSNNPVRTALGDGGRIAFNGDPGTRYKVAIFDMLGLLVWTDEGQVFAGFGGTEAQPTRDADFAVNYTWPLINRRGEAVASGMYLVVVEATVNGRRQLSRDRLMVIR